MKMVKLKNGAEVAEPIVVTTMISLKSLMMTDPIAFYELVEKCRDSGHEMWGSTQKTLEDLALMQNGKIHDCTKDVVLSAADGDGLNLSLVSPVAAKPVSVARDSVLAAKDVRSEASDVSEDKPSFKA